MDVFLGYLVAYKKMFLICFSEMLKTCVLCYLLCGGTRGHREQKRLLELFFYGGCFTIIIGILIFGETKKKEGRIIIYVALPLPLAVVLRSVVAPQRCHLSYTSAKVSNVSGTAKLFSQKFAKRGKVSQVMGQKRV